MIALLTILPVPPARAEPPAAPPSPPPPPSAASRLGVIRLDPRVPPAEALPAQPMEGLPPPPGRATPLRFPMENGMIFEPQLEQENPSSRLQLKGMFRMDLQRP